MARDTIRVTYVNDEGDDVEAELPAKNVVCERCDGHGTHLNPNIGGHAYTMEEFNESFDDEEREQYFTRGGIYDVTCEVCEGRNVVKVVDTARLATPEQKHAYRAWRDHNAEQVRFEIEWRQEREREARMLGEWDGD